MTRARDWDWDNPPPLPPGDEPWPDPGHEPRGPHCGVGGAPKPGHAEYRCCRCGQWYSWNGSLWRPVNHPPRRWLRKHGLGLFDALPGGAMLKTVAGLACAYELGALATGRYPTLTALSARHKWVGPLLVGALAVHLYRNPPSAVRVVPVPAEVPQ